MSHHATNWAIQQRGLRPAAKIVLWHLCDRHHPDHGCFPSQETLAEDCEMPRSTLNVYLAELEKAGLIARERRRHDGSKRQERTRYRFAFEPGFAPISAPEPSPDTGHGETCKSESRNPPEPSPENAESRVQNLDSNPVREPVREPVSEREACASAEGAREPPAETPAESPAAIERAFWRWFPTWPAYIDSSKPEALAAWRRLTAEERGMAVARQADYLEASRENGRKIVCSAGRYLSEKRWERLPEKPAAPAAPEIAKPLGKAWMAMWLAETITDGRPMPKPTPFVQRLIDEGGERAEQEIINRHRIYRWPRLAEMERRLREKEFTRAAPAMIVHSADFVSVELSGPFGLAWKRFFRRQLLPWPPDEGRDYAYFPPLPDGMDDTDKAVAAAYWGFKRRIGDEQHAA